MVMTVNAITIMYSITWCLLKLETVVESGNNKTFYTKNKKHAIFN